jgi:acyl-CoA reductase-like NAD-dependent aldehyde dehydrogenase
VAFTGGSESARHIVRNSAQNFAQVSLELGGKSPNIVFEDANPDNAAMGIIAGIFGASGQSCVAGSRAFLHVDIYDEVMQKLVDRVSKIKIGDPFQDETEMGPLATQAQLERVEKYVAIGLDEGGKLVCGGKKPEYLGKGWYFEPTIFEHHDNNSRITKEEIFGPVLSVIPFKNEEEVIQLANSTESRKLYVLESFG